MAKAPSDTNEVDHDAPTDTYRAEDYDELTKPVVTEAGIARPSETVEHRAPDYEEIMANSDKVTSTVTDKAETKVVKPSDSKTRTK